MIGMIMLSMSNQVMSQMISSQIDNGMCSFIMPSFSQDLLMRNSCPQKYVSHAVNTSDLRCSKGEIARIWEDNINMLVEDHDDKYGCLNMDCCDELDSFISARISIITVANIVIAIYLFTIMINNQYVAKVVSKYNI